MYKSFDKIKDFVERNDKYFVGFGIPIFHEAVLYFALTSCGAGDQFLSISVQAAMIPTVITEGLIFGKFGSLETKTQTI